MNEKKLTHVNESGEAHMVDVHEKADTYRVDFSVRSDAACGYLLRAVTGFF